MTDKAHSQTAELTAAIRAGHFLHDERPLVLEDPIAIDLLGPEVRGHFLDAVALDAPGHRRNAAVVLGRSRYAEDQLERAVRAGTLQYVLLGAGGDSFALRRPDLVAQIRVYELDQPATQAWKRDRLQRHGHELPASVEFVAADLEREAALEALGRSSFGAGQRAFFSWLGTTMYLTPGAIFRTLRSLAEALAAGSEIVFDYRVKAEHIDPGEVDSVLEGDRATAGMGEPKRSFFDPHAFPAEVESCGFTMLENLSPGQMSRRYFAGRRDGMRPATHHWYAHLRL